jgi:hypothetical protein
MLNMVEVGKVEFFYVLSTKDCICDNQKTKRKFVIMEWVLTEWTFINMVYQEMVNAQECSV